MTDKSYGTDTRSPAIFTQTDVRVHEAWARLCISKPRAAGLMHTIVSCMKRNSDAVVVSQKTLAKIMGCDPRTVRRAQKELVAANYIQLVKLGSGANAYVINRRVSWTGRRKNMQFARFDAQVIADADEQDSLSIASGELNKMPIITPPDEIAIPSGDGDIGEQKLIKGTEPSLETRPDENE